MSVFERDGIVFNYEVRGKGIPFLYLHGLGDNLQFALDTFQNIKGIQLIALDQRGHGKSGNRHVPMSFDILASDAITLMNELNIKNFFIGGLSMGAGVALNLAIKEKSRVLGLVLNRSSFTDQPMRPEVRQWFKIVSTYLPVYNGKKLFKADPVFQSIASTYPKAIETFLRYFDDEVSMKYNEKFVEMSTDTPIKDKSVLKGVEIPVLILANPDDFIHPILFSEFYKKNMSQVVYFELPSKILDFKKHNFELNTHVNYFIHHTYDALKLGK